MSRVDRSHAVDLVTDDYTKSTGRISGLFDIRGSEAPVMLKKNDSSDRVCLPLLPPPPRQVLLLLAASLVMLTGGKIEALQFWAGTYMVITATGCGFCPNSSDARVWTADTPLGPYTDSGRYPNPCAAVAAVGGGAGGGGPALECGLVKQSCMPDCGNKPHRVKA